MAFRHRPGGHPESGLPRDAIEVQPRGRNADVIHTSEVLFIDPQGHERYVATPDG